MNKTNRLKSVIATAALWMLSAAASGFLPAAARAAELQSLAWVEGATAPTLEVSLAGEATWETETLDEGRLLRLKLPGAKLGAGASDPGGRAQVKGAYPYLASDGAFVNVDFLLTEAGGLNVSKTGGGLRVEVAGAAATSAVASNAIEDISYVALPGNRLSIRMKMTHPPQLPNAFTITKPPRISLDFPGTRLALAKKSLKIGEGAVVSLNAVEAEGRARVVLNLVKNAGYNTSIVGNELILTVENPAVAVASTREPTVTQFASAVRPGRHSIRNIDFHRGPQGDGKLSVTLSDTGVGITIREQSGEIIVDFQDTNVPAELQKRLNVSDFATPVQNIETRVLGQNTRIVLAASGKYEHLAYQAGEQFTVNVKPAVEKAEKQVDEFGYSGEKLSLNFQNIEVRAALQVIADFTGLNIVTSDSVKGSLTLRLKDVPWDQALDIILKSKGLAKREKGNVITIGPIAEVAATEKASLEAAKTVRELEPLVSELIHINYAKADDIAKLLKSIKAVDTTVSGSHPVFGPNVSVQKLETDSNTLLSPRGQVTVDQRTNSLLIQDTADKIREVRKLIAQLDQPTRQVMIETRLVEATDDFSRSLGVRFGGQTSRTSQGVQATMGGSLSDPTALSVNLPATAPTGVTGISPGSIAFTIARLGTGDLLNLELSALEIEGRGKVISSPRLITANQKKARIEQGQERVFTTSVLGVGSTVTKKAVLALDVTPQITPDDRVILDVVVTKDSFADATVGLINKKEITTQVLLDNGETVVIGGIYEQTSNTSVNKIPFLGDLPLLGWAFRQNTRLDNKTELLIFLTPRILSETLSLR